MLPRRALQRGEAKRWPPVAAAQMSPEMEDFLSYPTSRFHLPPLTNQPTKKNATQCITADTYTRTLFVFILSSSCSYSIHHSSGRINNNSECCVKNTYIHGR